MKIKISNYKFLICFFLIFQIAILISLFFIKDLSSKVHSYNSNLDATYWLTPSFSVIQTGNIIASWGGIILSVMGSAFPKKLYKDKSIIKIIPLVLFFNCVFFIFSSLITLLFSLINFNKMVVLPHYLILHSLLMFIGVIIYLTFWFFIGFGLKLTFKYNFLSAIFCFVEQVFEVCFIFLHSPQLEQYLPLGLSRELITKNFTFWDTSSWASASNTVAYANSSLILNANWQVKNVNIIYILIALIIYILISYLFPVLKKGGFINVYRNSDRKITS